MAFEIPTDGRFRRRKEEETAEHYMFEIAAFYNLGLVHMRQIARAMLDYEKGELRERDNSSSDRASSPETRSQLER